MNFRARNLKIVTAIISPPTREDLEKLFSFRKDFLTFQSAFTDRANSIEIKNRVSHLKINW